MEIEARAHAAAMHLLWTLEIVGMLTDRRKGNVSRIRKRNTRYGNKRHYEPGLIRREEIHPWGKRYVQPTIF